MEDRRKEHVTREDSIHKQARTTLSLYKDCFRIVDGRPIYDFSNCLVFIEAKGQELFGENFSVSAEDHQLILKLLLYMIGDRDGADAVGLSLNKGLLLSGPIGCGKSTLMKLVKFFAREERQYALVSCREISFAFKKHGFDIIQHYSSSPSDKLPRAYCFDDLGTETNIDYYGTECNVMGEILLSRYDLFVTKRLKTHATTNCNSLELEKFYGNRVRSRMREMFNLIAFDKDARDKRV